ncbi:MAG: galactose-1-phosphate uridylyltransferase [Desulfobacteraceae bacterium]|nr:MAG: galactose-1-phosphate uridylyltransferase [Desulfobacteraceae bacterium]
MNEIRQNKATGQWVIIAPGRGKRPHDHRRAGGGEELLPEKESGCPFCPGNEEMLPSVILELGSPTDDGWQIRVVPNKFPALAPDASTLRYERGIYLAMSGYGRHEVIIESPLHNRQIPDFDPKTVDLLIETYHRRYLDLTREHKNMMVLIFRNHGQKAGTSLVHPHSQIIVTGMVPRFLRWREDEARRYFDEWGRCVYCDILHFELKERKRLVLENGSYAAFVPFAAEVPFETWIVPKEHDASFGSISDESKKGLSEALRLILARLSEILDDPHYNYIISSAPHYESKEPQLHWYLQIRPRLTTRAGFEIGSGISINPSLPEEDAAVLRF